MKYFEVYFCRRYCRLHHLCKKHSYVRSCIAQQEREQAFFDGTEKEIQKPFQSPLTGYIFELHSREQAGFALDMSEVSYKMYLLYLRAKDVINANKPTP